MQSRNTVQKQIIADTLYQLGNHPTVDQVYEAVRLQRPSISKATVYRVLKQMSASGDALRIPVAGGAEHFDHRVDPHCHVVCTECGGVDDVEAPFLTTIDWKEAQSATDYTLSGHSLQFYGVCPSCQKAAS